MILTLEKIHDEIEKTQMKRLGCKGTREQTIKE
jgi:hypothetical protein